VEEKNIRIKAQNYSCFDKSVRLLYSGSGTNSIGGYNNDKLLRKCLMTSDDWGGNFLNANGSVWVNDGKTLPAQFGQALQCEMLWSTGAGYLTVLTTNVGENLDAFFRRFAVAMSVQNPPNLGTSLANADPMGLEMYYQDNVLYMNPSMIISIGGSELSPQAFEIPTVSFPQTSFQAFGNPFTFPLKHEDGWNISIVVTDDTSGNYKELVNSLLDQSLGIDKMRKSSNSKEQVEEVALFKKYDSAGFSKTLSDTTVIDPYQFQNVLDQDVSLLIDGQTYMEVVVLAGEYARFTYYFEEAGILTYEQIASIDKILHEQGIDTMNRIEEEELESAFSNFSGFYGLTKGSTKERATKFILVGFIAYLLFKKN